MVECPHCKFISETFRPIQCGALSEPQGTNREYWLMTEVFVYLHGGEDYCDYEKLESRNDKI
jgi:hypothetical protein